MYCTLGVYGPIMVLRRSSTAHTGSRLAAICAAVRPCSDLRVRRHVYSKQAVTLVARVFIARKAVVKTHIRLQFDRATTIRRPHYYDLRVGCGAAAQLNSYYCCCCMAPRLFEHCNDAEFTGTKHTNSRLY